MDADSQATPDNPERDECGMRLCQALAERGLALARAAADEAQRTMRLARSPAAEAVEPVERFIRCSRAVRRAILLETRIAAGEYEPRLPINGGVDARGLSADELLEDDLAGEEYREVADILADIRAELGPAPLEQAAKPRSGASSRTRLNASSSIGTYPG